MWADFGQCGGRLPVSDFGDAIKKTAEKSRDLYHRLTYLKNFKRKVININDKLTLVSIKEKFARIKDLIYTY